MQCDEEAHGDSAAGHVRRGADGHRRSPSRVARVRVQMQTGRSEAAAVFRRTVPLPPRLAHVVRRLSGVPCRPPAIATAITGFEVQSALQY